MEPRSTIFKNNFLLARTVIFVTLMCSSLLSIGFASWTIACAPTNDLPVGSIMLIIIFPATLAVIPWAFAAMFYPKLRMARVKYELYWSIILSVINLVVMFVATVHPPAHAFTQTDTKMLISYALFLVAGWSTIILLAPYATALTVATMSHYLIYPNLMTSPVHNVPWFQAFDIENGRARGVVSMFFPPDLDSGFACRSPSWEGRFAGVKMHNGPFAVLTAKKAAEEAAKSNITEHTS